MAGEFEKSTDLFSPDDDGSCICEGMTLYRVRRPYRRINNTLNPSLRIVDEAEECDRTRFNAQSIPESLRRGESEFLYPELFTEELEAHPCGGGNDDENMAMPLVVAKK